MKTKTNSIFFLLLFYLLINISPIYPQMLFVESVKSDTSDENIKSLTARYYSGKVYLKTIINGLDNTTLFKVERSIDAELFEEIGSFFHYGTTQDVDILKCFIDANPPDMKAYYRLVRYDKSGTMFMSKTICVSSGSGEFIKQTFTLTQASN